MCNRVCMHGLYTVVDDTLLRHWMWRAPSKKSCMLWILSRLHAKCWSHNGREYIFCMAEGAFKIRRRYCQRFFCYFLLKRCRVCFRAPHVCNLFTAHNINFQVPRCKQRFMLGFYREVLPETNCIDILHSPCLQSHRSLLYVRRMCGINFTTGVQKPCVCNLFCTLFLL